MKLGVNFILLFIFFNVQLLGQCDPWNPPIFPAEAPPCNSVDRATELFCNDFYPPLCDLDDINGYCSCTRNGTGDGGKFCGDGTSLDNPSFFNFVASSEVIHINIYWANCTGGNGGNIQVALYEDCEVYNDACLASDTDCRSTRNPAILHYYNAVPGKTYSMLIDGCEGSICDFNVQVVQGAGEAEVEEFLDSSDLETPDLPICEGDNTPLATNFFVREVAGAKLYEWTVNGADNYWTEYGSFNLYDPLPGTYTLCVKAINDCDENNEICVEYEVVSRGDCYGEGILNICAFYDQNSDGLKQDYERFVDGALLRVNPGGGLEISNSNAYTKFYLLPGSYSVEVDTMNLFSYTSPLTMDVRIDSLNDRDTICFGILPIDTVLGTVNISSGSAFRCNRTVSIYSSFKNRGKDIAPGYLWFDIPNTVVLDTMRTSADSISGRSVGFYVDSIAAFESVNKRVIVILPGFDLVDELFEFNSYFVSELHGVVDSSDLTLSLLCAYDPNDKIVNADLTDSLSHVQDSLIYTVRFQNTGNDTAFVVRVIDTLSDKLDWSTFKFLGTSHPENVKITLSDEGVLEILYPDIMLPDTMTNFDASGGQFSFQIYPDSTLLHDEQILNTVYIYFDLNPPIVTNTTKTTLFLNYVDIGCFYDNDENELYNDADFLIDDIRLFVTGEIPFRLNSTDTALTRFYLRDGSYRTNAGPLGSYALTSDSSVVSFDVNRNSSPDTILFGMIPRGFPAPEIRAIVNNDLYCHDTFDVNLVYYNPLRDPLNGVLWQEYSPEFTYLESSNQPDFVEFNRVGWMITPESVDTLLIRSTFYTDYDDLGEAFVLCESYFQIESGRKISASTTDADLLCARADCQLSVDHDIDTETNPLSDSLVYSIAIQNVGSDTALNIVIVDSLSAFLDPESLRVLSSSHSEYLDEIVQRDGILEFYFTQVRLPQSDVNPEKSILELSFAIDPYEWTPVNSIVMNKVDAFLDQNNPVTSNTTSTTLVEGVINSSLDVISNSIRIFPNPASEFIEVSHSNWSSGHIQVVDISGNSVLSSDWKNGNMTSLHGIPPGVYFLILENDFERAFTKIVKE